MDSTRAVSQVGCGLARPSGGLLGTRIALADGATLLFLQEGQRLEHDP